MLLLLVDFLRIFFWEATFRVKNGSYIQRLNRPACFYSQPAAPLTEVKWKDAPGTLNTVNAQKEFYFVKTSYLFFVQLWGKSPGIPTRVFLFYVCFDALLPIVGKYTKGAIYAICCRGKLKISWVSWLYSFWLFSSPRPSPKERESDLHTMKGFRSKG